MLNIRINFNVDVRKVGSICAIFVLMLSHLILPPTAQALTASAPDERQVTVSLTYLTVTTTKSQAQEALASPTSKYFDVEALAFLTAYTNNWKMSEWKCLRSMWSHESHFNPKALNMHSGAYGVAQFLPSTWGNYKVTKTASARLQIQYGLHYIEKRYGNAADPQGACNAWRFWQKHNWY